MGLKLKYLYFCMLFTNYYRQSPFLIDKSILHKRNKHLHYITLHYIGKHNLQAALQHTSPVCTVQRAACYPIIILSMNLPFLSFKQFATGSCQNSL